MNISIIIPNFNGEQIMKKNLPHVLQASKQYKQGKCEIIITDDPSTDMSQQVIEEFINAITDKHITGKAIYNKEKKKSGFSKNVNRGVAQATGEVLILLNTDVAPHKDFLTPLIDHFIDPRVFAVGCMDESIEDGKVVLRGRGVGRWEKGFVLHQLGSLDKINTLWASGGSSAFRKIIWDQLCGLNELYNPFYWEDIDLSYRAQKMGYIVQFEKKSIVVHEHNKGAIRSNHKPYIVRKVAYRNQFFFVWLNITDRNLVVSHVLWLPYHCITMLMRGDTAFFAGMVAAFRHLPSVLRKRENMTRLFVTSDSEVLKQSS